MVEPSTRRMLLANMPGMSVASSVCTVPLHRGRVGEPPERRLHVTRRDPIKTPARVPPKLQNKFTGGAGSSELTCTATRTTHVDRSSEVHFFAVTSAGALPAGSTGSAPAVTRHVLSWQVVPAFGFHCNFLLGNAVGGVEFSMAGQAGGRCNACFAGRALRVMA
jgi:hypothetical protein